MNNKPKRYRLLKDLPDAEAGTIYEQIQTGDYFRTPTKGRNPQSADFYCQDTVENNPEWFEEIKEPEKIRVWHFGVMDDYPIKNRHNYMVCTSGEIPRHLFGMIEKAVERIINSPAFENEDDIKKYLERCQSAIYTQQELDKAIVDAFNAGRRKTSLGVGYFWYGSPQEYMDTIKNEKKSI